jgi:hypothetical protein
MGDELFFYGCLLVVVLWLCLTGYRITQQSRSQTYPTTPKSTKPIQQRCKDQKPVPGFTQKPRCTACEQTAAPVAQTPRAPPPLMTSIRGRWRHVDTSHQFCPHPTWRYQGWVGLGNIRANGHPSGGPWRQLHCVACSNDFLETPGTLFHGKRVPAGFCQVIEAETLIRQTGAPPRSYPPFRQPAPCP